MYMPWNDQTHGLIKLAELVSLEINRSCHTVFNTELLKIVINCTVTKTMTTKLDYLFHSSILKCNIKINALLPILHFLLKEVLTWCFWQLCSNKILLHDNSWHSGNLPSCNDFSESCSYWLYCIIKLLMLVRWYIITDTWISPFRMGRQIGFTVYNISYA